MEKGKFFVLEGLDGTGKTTIMEKIKKKFPDFVCTREPGGSEFGEMIRKVLLDPRSKNVPPLALLLGFMAARGSHFEELILPALERDSVVVSDRFDASTFAFQLYGQENPDLEDLFWYLREEIFWAKEGLKYHPNYIYLRIKPETAAKRRKIRKNAVNKETHFDLQDESYHQRVFSGYEKFFEEITKHASKTLSPSENPVNFVDASLILDEVYYLVEEIILRETS